MTFSVKLMLQNAHSDAINHSRSYDWSLIATSIIDGLHENPRQVVEEAPSECEAIGSPRSNNQETPNWTFSWYSTRCTCERAWCFALTMSRHWRTANERGRIFNPFDSSLVGGRGWRRISPAKDLHARRADPYGKREIPPRFPAHIFPVHQENSRIHLLRRQ